MATLELLKNRSGAYLWARGNGDIVEFDTDRPKRSQVDTDLARQAVWDQYKSNLLKGGLVVLLFFGAMAFVNDDEATSGAAEKLDELGTLLAQAGGATAHGIEVGAEFAADVTVKGLEGLFLGGVPILTAYGIYHFLREILRKRAVA